MLGEVCEKGSGWPSGSDTHCHHHDADTVCWGTQHAPTADCSPNLWLLKWQRHLRNLWAQVILSHSLNISKWVYVGWGSGYERAYLYILKLLNFHMTGWEWGWRVAQTACHPCLPLSHSPQQLLQTSSVLLTLRAPSSSSTCLDLTLLKTLGPALPLSALLSPSSILCPPRSAPTPTPTVACLL